jgi:ubiquinone biosynthesis protein Coq4
VLKTSLLRSTYLLHRIEKSIYWCLNISYREQPRINTSTIDVPALLELPEGTFGKEYTKFLDRNVSLSMSW